MAIVLDHRTQRQSWCSWHEDQEINRSQGIKLAHDVKATVGKLIIDTITQRIGRQPTTAEVSRYMTDRREPNSRIIWVCWGDEAIAVRTDAIGHIKDRRYYLTWHWLSLNDRN